jgi:hypothetical protein
MPKPNAQEKQAAIRVLRWAGYRVCKRVTKTLVNGQVMHSWHLMELAEELARGR